MALPQITITGSVQTGDGVGLTTGVIVAELSQPASYSDGTRVVSVVQGAITAGTVSSLTLAPNDVLTPAGTYYKVTIAGTTTDGRAYRSRVPEKWQLASTPASVAIGDVPRLDVVPGVALGLPASTATARGGVKLANDLGGTADAPTVVSTHLAAPLPEAQGGTGAATLGEATVTPTGGSPGTVADHIASKLTAAGGDGSAVLATAPGAAAARTLAVAQADAARVADLRRALFYATGGQRFDFVPHVSCLRSPTQAAGDLGEPLSVFTRASVAQVRDLNGTEYEALANWLRLETDLYGSGGKGLLIEPTMTQMVSAPDAPETETKSWGGPRYFYCWIEGSGSLTIAAAAAGGATGTGWGTVTAGSPLEITVTGTGNVDVTVAGAVTFAQIQKTVTRMPFKSSKIHTGDFVRQYDEGQFIPRFRGPAFVVDCTFSLRGAYSRPTASAIWSMGTNGYGANQASLQVSSTNVTLVVADSAGALRNVVVSAAGLAADSEHRWTCCVDTSTGRMAVYLDGVFASSTVTGAGTGIWTAYPSTINLGRLDLNDTHVGGWLKSIAFHPSWDPSVNAEAPGARIIDVALFGDSRAAQSLAAFESLGSAYRIVNEGFGGISTPAAVTRWTGRVRAQRHRYLVIQLGINDMGNGWSPATAWANIKTIVDAAADDGTIVILTTVFPFKGASYYSVEREANRQTLNASILAYSRAGLRAVDMATLLDDGAGALAVAYDSGDHLHLSAAGNALFAATISPYLVA